MKRCAVSALLFVATISALAGLVALPHRSMSQAADRGSESLMAFDVMATVMNSPRCHNCHTLTDFPRQGDDQHRHRFNVTRGPNDRGAAGLPCSTCHGRTNNLTSGVPGADEDWRLAPIGMGWDSLSKAELCHHIKDPKRNGNRTGAQVVDHLKTHLVMWAWAPGADSHGQTRATPALPYEDFIRAAEVWVHTGEACP